MSKTIAALVELFNNLAGIRMTHVPYKGLSPAFSDIINGQVVALMCPIASALPFVKAGRLRALAITTRERSPLVADVPTVKEATGIDGVYVDTWHGIVAPAGTPRTVVAKLSREIIQVVSRTDVRERFVSQGAAPAGNSPDEFAAEIRREIQKWRKVIKEAGIKAG